MGKEHIKELKNCLRCLAGEGDFVRCEPSPPWAKCQKRVSAILAMLDKQTAFRNLLEALMDLTALYAATPGHDPCFIKKGQSAIAKAQGD